MKVSGFIRFWMLLVKCITNQRGSIGDGGAGEAGGNGSNEEPEIPGFLKDTPFKTPEELAKGYSELNRKFGEQGNELGIYKGQAQTLAETLKHVTASGKTQDKPVEKAGPDYEAQKAEIQKEIMGLDPLGEGYQSKLAALIDKSSKISAMEQHERTLGAASNAFKKELDERDAKAAQDKFYQENPDFNTPETQMEIKKFLSSDKTGMHDAFSAYFNIKALKLAEALNESNVKYSEMEKLVELNGGKEKVAGKTMAKTQTPGASAAKPQKATGAALFDGMRQALANLTKE